MNRLNSHHFVLFAIAWLCLVSFSQAQKDGSEPAVKVEWTETDSRLANHYIRLLQQKPEYGNVLDLLWDLYEKKNQTPLLMNYMKKAAAPDQAYIPKLIFAHLLRKSDRIDEAKDYYDDVVNGVPENIPALKALAEISEQQKRQSKALSYYTRLIRLIPSSEDDGVAIRLRKAAIHQSQDQIKQAVAIWNELLRARPADVKIRGEIVAMMLEVGETASAIDVLEEQAQSKDVRTRLAALSELEKVYELINDFEGASRAAREAMDVLHFRNHQHRDFFERLVRLHERFNRLTELEQRLESKVNETNPSESSLYQLATFYQLTANSGKEEEILKKLVAILPKSVDYRVRLSELQLANDRYDESAETLDAILAEQESVPLHLILLRVQVDLNAEEQMAAESRLADYLKANSGDSELREKIIDFARANYLDKLVEQLLRESVDGVVTGSDGDSAPLDLARFLHERGRKKQAREVIEKFVEAAGDSQTERTRRLHQASLAYRDLDIQGAARKAINQALESNPQNVDYLTTKAGLQIDKGETEAAVKTLEKVWDLHTELKDKIDVDQKIFSLLRAHNDSPLSEPDPALSRGPISSIAEYRKRAAAASRTGRDADEAPPRILLDYFDKLRKQADRLRTIEHRYRAGWWAFKLQENHECYHQLQSARQESPKPVIEVEELLLELAEQNERPTHMERHLTALAEADPANRDEYLQRRAEVWFELGYEDKAVRELRRLANLPTASLNTLNALANVYGQQGSSQKQIEVWQTAYRKANLFDKRRIVRQLTSALIEQRKPKEALKAQMDLVERETDMIQRRKHFETQLTVASRHYLLDWLKTSYIEAAQQRPFDRFFPEALGRIYLAMDDERNAFDAMKKAYYMGDQNEELLDELADLASRLGDLNSAIYYSRQTIAKGKGNGDLDSWQNLIRMLEKDFRSGEAELMRKRLEIRFGQDPDFLAQLATFYHRSHRLSDAHRIYGKRAKLRDWDVSALFDYALIKLEMGDQKGASRIFNQIINKTVNEEIPDWARNPLWPVIETGEDLATQFESLNFDLQTFPLIPVPIEDEFSVWTESQTHPEFAFRPTDKYAIRLRAIEEAGKCVRFTPRRDAWVNNLVTAEIPDHEKWWAAHYAGSGEGVKMVLREIYPDAYSAIADYTMARSLVRAGEFESLREWVASVGEAGLALSFPATNAAVFACYRMLRDPDSKVEKPDLVAFLQSIEFPATAKERIYRALVSDKHFAAASDFGSGLFEETASGDFAWMLSQLAEWRGEPGRQAGYLDQYLDRGIEFDEEGLIPTLTQVAIADRYRISETADEQKDLLELLGHRLLSGESNQPMRELETRFLIGNIVGDYDSAFRTLKNLPTEIHRSKTEWNGDYRNAWDQAVHRFRHFTELIPRRERLSVLFAESIGGDFFNYPGIASAKHSFEEYEMERFTRFIEGKRAAEISIWIDQVLPAIDNLDTRLDLARDLEAMGLNREAAQIYHREVINGSEDYAPLRDLFKTSILAQYPELALDVIEKIDNNELAPPPGLTDGYLNQQRARFLWLSREIDELKRRSEPPQLDGGFAVKTTVHLPYQRELINHYRVSGQSAALFSLLAEQRERGESGKRDLLLGAKLLIREGRYNDALEWLDAIQFNQGDFDTEIEALHQYFTVFKANDEIGKNPFKWLGRVSLQYQSRELTEAIARHMLDRGEIEEATSLLRVFRRTEKDPALRSAIQFRMLDAVVKHEPENQKALSREVEIFLAGLGDSYESGWWFAVWVNQNRELLAGQVEILESFGNHPRAGSLARLSAACIRNELEGELARLKEEISNRDQFESILYLLPFFGEPGKELAIREVEERGQIGPLYFAGYPERQFRFFSAIEDHHRLRECHSTLMRMADSYFFFQPARGATYGRFEHFDHLPGLLDQLGHQDLAGALYQKYFASIRHFRESNIPFAEAYVDFLIRTEEFESAETVLGEVLRYSLGFDLRKLVNLYEKWGKLDSIEASIERFDLTSGQNSLIMDWLGAVEDGRELVKNGN